MKSFHISLKNTSNTRSLSPLLNKRGEHIKRDALIRSDALNHIQKEDIEILFNEYNLRRVIDLRCDNEVIVEPDVQIQGVQYLRCPILPNERVGITKKGNDQADFDTFIHEIYKNGVQSSIVFMKKVYEDLVSPFANEGYKKFLNILLEETDGATLWHCSAGKDRAGFATLLILYILDFDLDVIKNDYIETNEYYKYKVSYFVKKYGEEYKEVLEAVFGVNEQFLDVLFQKIEEKYGNLDTYISQALDITLEKKDKLRQMYLGE